MKYNPTAATIHEYAGALRRGRNPAEVADMLDGLADRMNKEEARDASASTPPPDHNGDALADITGRLQALHDAMCEAAKKEALHPSVRFLADTIALNLAAPTMATDRPITDATPVSALRNLPQSSHGLAGPHDNLIYFTVCDDPIRADANGLRVYAIPYSRCRDFERSTEEIASDRGVSDV